MNNTAFVPYAPENLPYVVRSYLETHRDGDRETLSELFTQDATVTDENIEYAGVDAIRDWLGTAASEYTYTTDYTEQAADASDRWTVKAHLKGDFPGGEADLRFQFWLEADKVKKLVIEP